MIGEIICVGTELLLGDTENTNATYLAKQLAQLGISVYHQTVVGDNSKRLAKAASQALNRSDIVVFTGGLGPTPDDITKETICSVMGIQLIKHKLSLQLINEYFENSGKKMPASNIKQAMAPENAIVFKNECGTAPGYSIENRGKIVIMMPGPPIEMTTMFETYVNDYLRGKSDSVIVSHNVNVVGLGESIIAERMERLLSGSNPTVSTYAKTGEVYLRVTAKAANRSSGDIMCDSTINEIKHALGNNVYGVNAKNLQAVVVGLLRKKGLKIATAESCTAGCLSSKITDVAGSSDVFEFGITAYSNSIKKNALGVCEDTLKKYSSVSPAVAAEMAAGVNGIAGSDLGVSITGEAGPQASTASPVGLVYIAVAYGDKIWVQKLNGIAHGNDRNIVREVAALRALDFVRRILISSFTMDGVSKIGEILTVLDADAISLADVKAEKSFKPIDFNVSSVNKITDAEIFGLMQSTFEESNTNDSDSTNVLKFEGEEDDSLLFLSESLTNQEPTIEETGFLEGYFGANEDDLLIGFNSADDLSVQNDVVNIPTKKKQTIANRFVNRIFPSKDKGVKGAITNAIFLIAIICLVGFSIFVATYFIGSSIQLSVNNDMRRIYSDFGNNELKDHSGIYMKFIELLAINADTKGWIKIGETQIDLPIVQSSDNQYYVKNNFRGNKSTYGTLFFDCKGIVSDTGNSQNLVVYGHSMRDGSMFAELKNYRNIDFYRKNPTITMDTIYSTGTYKVFAVFITNSKADHNNGNVFNYRPAFFETQNGFMNWIDNVRDRSLINSSVDVVANDEILTLSTGAFDFEDAHLVVMARRIRTGESLAVNMAETKINPKPLFPQIWYDKFGGSAPNISENNNSDVLTQSQENVDATQQVNSESEPDNPVNGQINNRVNTQTNTSTPSSNRSNSTTSSKITTSNGNEQSSGGANTVNSGNTSDG